MNKRTKRAPSLSGLLPALILIVIAFILFCLYFPNNYSMKSPQRVEVLKGQTLNQTIDQLAKENIIVSRKCMKIASLFYSGDKRIKPGSYEIPNGKSNLGILEIILSRVRTLQGRVTIVEGMGQTLLARSLENGMGIDSASFMRLSSDRAFLKSLNIDSDNLEGYLLPDTYFFDPKTSAKEIVRKFADAQNDFFTPERRNRIREMGLSRRELLTMASIVQGEATVEDEMPCIAAVYYNRMRKGMPLQADPTVQFLVRDKHKGKVYYKDLEIHSPFNTYKVKGLPPRPINNPGRKAILAALNPEKNDYLYFVADGTGRHKFSKTFSEHSQKVRQYRKWEKSRQ